MDYQQAIDYILGFADFERTGRFADRPDVGPVSSLLGRLGHPHLGRTTVHVAGSKGKGSVAAMVECVLRQAGLRTGLFTSPHLHSFYERIRIDGEPIAEAEFARLTEALRPAAETERDAAPGRQLVTFDLLTALAFLAFRQGGVQAQVVEVGLGGRLDSTNVFTAKDVCIITPISLEHTAILGDSVEQIAREKAAIIRPAATVVMAPQAYPAAKAEIRRAASAAAAPVVDVVGTYAWKRSAHDLDGQTFRLDGPGGVLRLRLPLLGEHQLENAATAVACIDALRRRNLAISDRDIVQGLAGLRWPGRLEVLGRRPLIVADGAHNRDSARRLRQSLTDYLYGRPAFLVVGTSADKDIHGLAEELAPVTGYAIATQARHPRAMAAAAVMAALREAGISTQTLNTVPEALERAVALVGPESLICVVGSLFLAAEAREYLLGVAAASALG